MDSNRSILGKTFRILTPISSLLLFLFAGSPAQSEVFSMSDADLEGVSAKGDIAIGSYQWNDDHQFDSSINKGALILDGNAQQYATGENIVNATQSAVATGVTVTGDMNSTGGTISITNTNEATALIGGF